MHGSPDSVPISVGHGPCRDEPSVSNIGHSSSSSAKPSTPPLPLSSPRRRRRRNISLPPFASALAALASICDSTVDAANPLPCPDFLCPHSSIPTSVSSSLSQHLYSTRSATPGPRRRQSSNSARSVPTKYSQGVDGRWRVDTAWSLHGQSLSCVYAPSTPTDNPIMSDSESEETGANDNLDAVNTTSEVNALGVPSQPSDLPKNWLDPPRSGFYSAKVIVVFSLSLAAFIALLITICALNRRKRHVRRKGDKPSSENQLEEVIAGPSDDPALTRIIKKKKRVWARGTARWKANAHFSMRRRKGAGAVRSNAADINPEEPETTHETASIVLDTPLDISSETAEGISDLTPIGSTNDALPATLSRSSSTYTLSLPPAYRTRNSQIQATETSSPPTVLMHSSEVSDSWNGRLHFSDISRHIPDSSASVSSSFSADQRSAALAGHVAVDDKALLARMADYASRPLETDASECSPAVPHLEQVVSEDVVSLEESSSSNRLSSPIPRPPSPRNALPDLSFYEVLTQPVPEDSPSAPPEEEEEIELATVPTVDDLDVIPDVGVDTSAITVNRAPTLPIYHP